MDTRRTSRVSDPKVRQVGFFAPGAPPPTSPDRTQSGPPAESSSPPISGSPTGNSLSPVMIPPPRHASDNLSSSVAHHHHHHQQQQSSRAVGVPVPAASSTLRRPALDDDAVVGSYNQSDSILVTSPSAISPSCRIGDGEFSEDSANWIRRSNSGKFASSVPAGDFDLAVKNAQEVPEKGGGQSAEISNELSSNSKPLKEKTTKAERRALQESQRAAKAAAKEGKKTAAAAGVAPLQEQTGKNVKQSSLKKEDHPVAALEKKGGDRQPEKDRKKDVPPPRMQFDNKSRVEKAKRRSLFNQPEARNRVELFRHLPQYEHGTQLPDLEAKFFQLDQMHPAVYKVGLQYLAGDMFEDNARCIAMLQAFREAIKDYCTPAEKALARDLTAKINSYVSFLIECRPLSISMGNAIRFLKARIAKSPLTLSETEAKATLCSDIDRFINEKIILADKVIVRHAATKIRDGDVLLTYGSSSVVEMILLYAHELRKQFRVVVVDSRPTLEGQSLLRRLVGKGLPTTHLRLESIPNYFYKYIIDQRFLVFQTAEIGTQSEGRNRNQSSSMEALLCWKIGDPTLPPNSSQDSPLTLSASNPIPELNSPTAVRVRVKATSLNFANYLQIQGKYQEKPPLPFIPGSDYSGVVESIGPKVSKFKVGDPVCSFAALGTFAQFIVADESELYRVPNECDLVAAGALPVAYGTSHVALVHRAHLSSGQVLLVLGAAGGVGVSAVQIGKVCGATVIAVARGAEKLQFLKSLGADHVVDLSKESLTDSVKEFLKARKLKGVDVLYDPVGGKLTKEAMKLLKWGAQILVIGFASGEIPVIPANIALIKNWTVHGLYWGSYKIHQPAVLEDSLKELLSWLTKGLITMHISHTYSLSKANLAFSALKDRKAIGKVVITFDDGASARSKL